MKLFRIGFLVFASTVLFLGMGTSQAQPPSTDPVIANSAEANPFLGRWDLTLYAPDQQYSSWLELTDNGGQLQGRMVGRWGSAHPILNVKIQNSVLTFASPKEEEDTPKDMPFQAKLIGGRLMGTMSGPDGTTWKWTGVQAPSLEPHQGCKVGQARPAVQRKRYDGLAL